MILRYSVNRHTLLRSSVVYQRLSRSMQQHTRYHNIEVLVCFDAFGCVICYTPVSPSSSPYVEHDTKVSQLIWASNSKAIEKNPLPPPLQISLSIWTELSTVCQIDVMLNFGKVLVSISHWHLQKECTNSYGMRSTFFFIPFILSSLIRRHQLNFTFEAVAMQQCYSMAVCRVVNMNKCVTTSTVTWRASLIARSSPTFLASKQFLSSRRAWVNGDQNTAWSQINKIFCIEFHRNGIDYRYSSSY